MGMQLLFFFSLFHYTIPPPYRQYVVVIVNISYNILYLCVAYTKDGMRILQCVNSTLQDFVALYRTFRKIRQAMRLYTQLAGSLAKYFFQDHPSVGSFQVTAL